MRSPPPTQSANDKFTDHQDGQKIIWYSLFAKMTKIGQISMWQLLKQSIYVPNAFRKDFFASKTVIKEFLDKHIMCAPFVSGLNLCKF